MRESNGSPLLILGVPGEEGSHPRRSLLTHVQWICNRHWARPCLVFRFGNLAHNELAASVDKVARRLEARLDLERMLEDGWRPKRELGETRIPFAHSKLRWNHWCPPFCEAIVGFPRSRSLE